VTALDDLWQRLGRVRSLSFVASSSSTTGWNGRGSGTVEVAYVTPGVITFNESGAWKPDGSEREIRFRNVYRWTLADDVLRLEHLRFGEANPVHLLDLTKAGEGDWRPVSPHVCRADCYSAVLTLADDGIFLRWSIDGPRKRETIEYVYA
jgi:hypothetical protein